MSALLPVLAAAGALVLAGCFGPSSAPPRVSFTTGWEPDPTEPVDHLVVSLENVGDQPARIGPNDIPLNVTGPEAPVPVSWGDAHVPHTLGPGERATLTLHPRTAEGRFVLAIDHSTGELTQPPLGRYLVCIQGNCMSTQLPR